MYGCSCIVYALKVRQLNLLVKEDRIPDKDKAVDPIHMLP